MEYICSVVQILALFLSTLWFFTWICERRNGPGRLFELKRQLAVRWISRRKKHLDYTTNEMEKLIDGVRRNQCNSNVINYYGADLKNNFLFIKINHRKGEYAELTLFLNLADGRTYSLPDHPNTVITDFGNSSWTGVGLKIVITESRKRARILFNGLLRKRIRNNINDNNDDNDDDIEHVRFNCIFIANTRPTSQEEYWSLPLQAEMLALNSWKKSKWHQLIHQLGIDGIDQYGSIIGQITFEDSSNVELYLRSLRQCQWGNCDGSNYEQNIRIVGFDYIGTSFYINLADIKGGIKHMNLGHVKYPTDALVPISSLSFDVKHFIDRFQSGFDEYEFQFTAGSRKYEAIIKLRRKNERIVYGGYPWDCKYAYYNFELNLNDTTGIGVIELWQPYSDACPIRLLPPNRFIKTLDNSSQDICYTLSFQDKRCQNENLVGGKGSSLAELSSIETKKFSVPKGFCITAHALESHINYHQNLTETIDEFVNICCEEKSSLLKEHCQKIVNLLENTPILDTVQNEILEALKQLESNGEKNTYAVRSSAVGEDSEDTSAAGQNSTFLGIKSADDVIKYVAHCWASLYTQQSVEYRRQHGLPIKSSMGVCVQQMVDADAAGVMFTRHPITGNPKEILITSNYGLGESVVSALVDPDTIIIHRSYNNSLSLKSSKIGEKSEKVTINNEAGGTVHSSLSDQDTSKLSISTEMTLKLAEIGVILDQMYDSPRDIEWAISKDQIYLLQCRPVTALDAWTDLELTHELGSGVVYDGDILTFANVGEVLPMVVTPLTLSSVVHGINCGTAFSVCKEIINDTYTSYLSIVNMRCTLNYMNLLLRFVEDKISQSDRVMEIAVCGHSILTPEIHEAAKKRNDKIMKKSTVLKLMLQDLWNNSAEAELAKNIVNRWKHDKKYDEYSSAKMIHTILDEMINDFSRMSGSHSHTTKCSIFYQVLAMSILTEGSENLTVEHYSDIAILLGSCSDVISAQVPVALKKITQTIKEHGLGEQFKTIDLLDAMNWLKTNCPKAHEQVQEFIKIHGHRGIEEFDLITETWGMKPEKFLATVQSMINTTDSTLNKDLTPYEAVSLLKTPKKTLTRWILRMMLPATRKAVAYREGTKAHLIEMVHLLRLTYLRLADLLTKDGKLPEKELIFFLTHAEIGEIIQERKPALIRKATKRRKLRPQLQKYKYQEVNYGMPKPIDQSKKFTLASDGIKVQGTSVCNGIVTGRTCVALTLEEAAEIRNGDILITTATDIGWSPYFPLLGGVVTELGGLISHGAVVAREYGLPCIVGVENATRIFKTGETVTLNGYTGTLEVVKEVIKDDA